MPLSPAEVNVGGSRHSIGLPSLLMRQVAELWMVMKFPSFTVSSISSVGMLNERPQLRFSEPTAPLPKRRLTANASIPLLNAKTSETSPNRYGTRSIM